MKVYTAQEMLVRANYLEGALADAKTAAMLRQAADKLEREAACEKSSQVGNAAAMREALETISKCDISKEEDCYRMYRICDEALSAPARNCDVGTAEEQTSRFVDFCHRSEACVSCQMEPKGETDCILAWAQKPYDEGGAE